jgi:hypothetical protein
VINRPATAHRYLFEPTVTGAEPREGIHCARDQRYRQGQNLSVSWHRYCIADGWELKMREIDASIGTVSLGDIVVASCELGRAVAPDGPCAMDLAAHHVGRILARGKNAALINILTAMAREFPGAASSDTRPSRRRVDGRRSAARRPVKRAA